MLKPTSIYSKIILIIFTLFLPFASSFSDSPDPVRGKNGMVVSAHELASKVGIEILQKGGNSVDAAVAVGFALAVVYPQAGNIGGGGFMVIHFPDGKNTTIDYREKAPLKAHRDMYLDENGNFLIELSSKGILSSGVPGSVAGLLYALEKYGSMPLSEVIQPAINLANEGFPICYRMANSLAAYAYEFNKYESSKKIFTNDGKPWEEGHILQQTDLAQTLIRIKEKGRAGFYEGETADLVVNQMNQMNGLIGYDDLKNYNAVERKPIIGDYRGFRVISMGPPSSGGIAIMQALNILENFSFSREEWNSSLHIHRLVEALKYVYADRSKHLGDEDFYPVPKKWIISKEYAKEIFGKITDMAKSSEEIFPGAPPNEESKETTHYSVIDKNGMAVSVTTTINTTFGNKIVVEGAGFLLNNEMDDFSAKVGAPNQFGLLGEEANSIQPEKRMLSAMTPTILLKDEKPFMVIGSPGGSTIITVVLQVIMNCVDFGMDIQEAIDAPRIHHQWKPDEIVYEEYGINLDAKNNLIDRGHKFGHKTKLGRAEGILVDSNRGVYWGATDPRGFGKAVGY